MYVFIGWRQDVAKVLASSHHHHQQQSQPPVSIHDTDTVCNYFRIACKCVTQRHLYLRTEFISHENGRRRGAGWPSVALLMVILHHEYIDSSQFVFIYDLTTALT